MMKYCKFLLLFPLFVVGYSVADQPDAQIVLPLTGASASSSYDGNNLPSYAIDTSTATYWNSGRSASANTWIQFDIGQKKPISKLRLRPAQLPAGTTTHKIYVGDTPSTLQLANSITSYTTGGVTFEVPVMKSGRYIRIVTTQSPSWVAWEQVDAYEAKGVKYYGYYLGGDYISQTAYHSNLSFFYGDASFPSKINNAISHNMKAVVSVDQIFFNGKYLRSDYLARWNGIKNLMTSYSNQIAAFYVIDEPARIGASQADIQVAINTLKSSFPSVPTASIFDCGHVNGLVGLFDWVGVDCYDYGTNGVDHAPTLAEAMRWKLDLSRQRLILVPQAGMARSAYDMEDQEAAMRYVIGLQDETVGFQDVALNDPLVIAVMPFIWQSFDQGSNHWYGLEYIGELQAWFANMGYAVVSQSNQRYGNN